MNREEHITLYAISVIANGSLNALQLVKSIEQGQNKKGARRQKKTEMNKLKLNAETTALDHLQLILSGDTEAIVDLANQILIDRGGSTPEGATVGARLDVNEDEDDDDEEEDLLDDQPNDDEN